MSRFLPTIPRLALLLALFISTVGALWVAIPADEQPPTVGPTTWWFPGAPFTPPPPDKQ